MKKGNTFGMSNWKKKILSNSGLESDEGSSPFLFSHNKGSDRYARKSKEAALQTKQSRAANREPKENIRGVEEQPTPATTWRSRNRKDIHKSVPRSKPRTGKE